MIKENSNSTNFTESNRHRVNLMFKVKKNLWWMLYWFLYSGIFRIFIADNNFLLLVPDIWVLIIWFFSFKYKSENKIQSYVGKYIPLLISAFIILGTVSAIIEGLHLSSFLWNIRFYIRYPLIIILIWKYFNFNDIPKFKKIIYKAYPINFIFALIEWRLWGMGDHIGGIFVGGNSFMVLYLLPTLIFIIGDYFQKKIGAIKFYFSIIIAMFLSFIGEIKLLYIVIPLFVYAGYVLLKRFTFVHIIVLTFSCFSFVPVMESLLSLFYDDDYVEGVFDTSHNLEYTAETSFIVGQEHGFNRSSSIELSNELFLKDYRHKFIGYGFGAASVSDLFYHPIGSMYKFTYFFLFSPSYLLVETGWTGFFLFVIIYILLLFRYLNIYYHSKDMYVRYWGYIGIMMCLFTFIMLWYNNSPLLSYPMPIYYIAITFVALRSNVSKYRLN